MSELFGSQAGFDKKGPGFRTLVVLLCISAVIITVYSQEGNAGPIHMLRSGAHMVAAPFQKVGSILERPFDMLGKSVENFSADAETLSDLRTRNAQLVSQLSELTEYRSENETLRAMLGLLDSGSVSGIAASVIASSQDSWSYMVTIDKGSNSGIAVDMPVSDGRAIIGQVAAVSPSTSTVRLVTDPSFKVSAVVQGTNSIGVLSGALDGTVHLDYVSTSVPVKVGDIVVTSGLSDVYPKAMPIGTVASVYALPTSLYYEIVVTPASNVGNASDALVITSYLDYYGEVTANEE